ncbi:MAG: ribosomal protection-like ABC-F family protein [Anaerolineae bacterium]|jgi:ATP-binding cassette subfamily F protein 3
MLHVSNLSKHYGDVTLFEQVNFVVNRGERLGLVGPNGCGKTTLLRILLGIEPADSGSVRYDVPRWQIGYLPQALQYDADMTVRDALKVAPDLDADYWAARIEDLAERMAGGDDDPNLEAEYAQALERLSHAATILPEHLVAQVLAGLDLDDVPPDTPVAILSGGQKTRLSLARILLQEPVLLVLDEPTNHLDITALEWLEGYLSTYAGAILLVSHDRTFLDRTVTRILEMDPVRRAVREYAGNYSEYALAKESEREKEWQAYQDQQEKIARLEGAVRHWKGHASKIEGETIHYHYRKIAKKVARQAVVRQRRLERLLESEDRLDKPKQGWRMKLEFVDTPPSGQDVLIFEGVGKRFGERHLFEDVNLTLRRGERIALVGPNGSGKTTLLRIVVGESEPSSGTVRLGAGVRVGYFTQEQESLNPDLSPLETVRRNASLSETDARNFLHYFMFSGDEVFVPMGRLSYGERARLALGVLVLQGCNLLLLDEPINHLDIPSRESFEAALEAYEGTILAVVHDRYFIERFATGIWSVEDKTVRPYVDLEDMRRGRDTAAPERPAS